MATHVVTPTTLTLSERRLPRSSAALRARRRPEARRWSWVQMLRSLRLLPQPAVCCDSCKCSMNEFQQMGTERLCIRCVADRQLTLASPALAGALAVLRTLWREAEIERAEQVERPFHDARRSDAIREVGELVMWWLTPRGLRPPGMMALGESTALEAMAAFDRVWALRCSQSRLGDVYQCWATRRAKALRYAEQGDLDRRYAALIEAETARS
jgi:hypothetical protein